jgi:hypothetical protein
VNTLRGGRSPNRDDVREVSRGFDPSRRRRGSRSARGRWKIVQDRKESVVASYAGRTSRVADDEYASGAGWIMFASIMLLVAGTWNLIDGILAIGTSRVYVGHQVFVFSDLKTWGWIITILGVLEVLAAFSIMAGNAFGRWFGIGAASINAIGQLFFVPAYPLWSLAMFSVDILIIYALAVYGGRRFETA